MVDELSKEPLAGVLVAADAVYVCSLSSTEPLRKQIREEDVEPPDAVVFDAR